MPARKRRADPPADQPLVVLVVEDEPANRLLLQTVVEDVLGGRAIVAANGVEALAAVEREMPDVVLLDLMLPALDGFAVAARLKGDPKTARLPIIAISALARPEDEQAARQAGCDTFLVKPFDLADVERAIRTLVPGKQTGSTPPAQDQ